MAATRPDGHALTDRILDRLIADNHGDQPWADLVLAACNGPDGLSTALDRHAAPRPARDGVQDTEGTAAEPPGAYLRSITVEGFRGIGPATTLTLTPGPGLTLVVGRHGSAWFQPKGTPRQPYEESGWHTAIRTHRPLLPYTELGTVFDKPSEIHDALVDVLGLGEFDSVQKTLQGARKAREAIVASAGDRDPALAHSSCQARPF